MKSKHQKLIPYSVLVLTAAACARAAQKHDKALAAAGWSSARTAELVAHGIALKDAVSRVASEREALRQSGAAVGRAVRTLDRVRGAIATAVHAYNRLHGPGIPLAQLQSRALGRRPDSMLRWASATLERLASFDKPLRPLVGFSVAAKLAAAEAALASAAAAHDERHKAVGLALEPAHVARTALTAELRTLEALARAVFRGRSAVIAEFKVSRRGRRHLAIVPPANDTQVKESAA
jgi:hypothetical protein